MKRFKATIFFLICLYIGGFGQSTLSGLVSDTTDKRALVNGSVILITKSDSVLVAFGRTDQTGHFTLRHLHPGNYLLLVTFPKYADFIDDIQIRDSTDVDLHIISMILKSQLLQEVVVTGNRQAIRMKGDTTEFKADSFKVQQGATVEELLKKLPGIQVDKNGKITAQGETVRNVLVDGEEFFGDDPTLVTQNLRADMVDRVQVYDKKSDQAAFTGIDDGQKTKTINLKLKDDKKNGYFGKLEASQGTDGYSNYQLMYNLFKKKQKLAVYGIASNTGKTGLNWQENNSYGQSSASNFDYDENQGGFTYTGDQTGDDLESWSGQYEGKGFPSVLTAGLHYNNKWSGDKQSINGNYKILQLQVNGQEQTNSQSILPDTTFFNSSKSSFNNKIFRNKLSGIYEFNIDSTSSIKLNADGGADHKITSSQYYSEARAKDSSLVNQGNRNVSTTGDINTINSNLIWRKKLKKRGRTISLSIRETYKGAVTDGSLYAQNDFYSGSYSPKQVIDQHKNFNNKNLLLDSRITYSEPLSRSSALLVTYGISVDNSNSNRSSYSRDSNGKYTALDSLYSNDYLFNVFTQRAGLNYHLGKKKLKFNGGSDIGLTNFKQDDIEHNSVTNRKFVNWYPRANLSYAFNQTTNLGIYYDGSSVQPTIQQIQPIANNEDPLNITVGNPYLRPQFVNNMSIYYNSFKVLSERYMYGNVSSSFTQNAISVSDNVDSVGRKVSQAINVNGNHSFNIYFGYFFKVKKIGLDIQISPSFNTNRYESVVNHVANITNSGNYSMGLGISKSKEKKYNLSLSGNITYTQSSSSIQTNIKTNYYTYNIRPDFDVFLPKSFQIHSDCDFNFRQKTPLFTSNTNVAIWNAWVGKKFLKNDALLVKVSANDILNMNIGFNRSVSSNYISQNTYTTIQRYYMLSVIWNFNKAGTPAPKNN